MSDVKGKWEVGVKVMDAVDSILFKNKWCICPARSWMLANGAPLDWDGLGPVALHAFAKHGDKLCSTMALKCMRLRPCWLPCAVLHTSSRAAAGELMSIDDD